VTRICLDTSAYGLLMRGDVGLRTRLEEADEVLLPVTVLGELHAGFRMGSRREENLAGLNAFLNEGGVRIVPTTDNVAERYGVLVQQLRERGTPIPTNDIWIAAAVLETGARLIAYDAHFRCVMGVLVESP